MAESPKFNRALIVGAGSGLSASLARLFSREGIDLDTIPVKPFNGKAM